MAMDRRWLLKLAAGIGLSGSMGLPRRSRAAATITDGAGREVPIPQTVRRIFPAGPPAAITTYTLSPDLLLGWSRANRADERAYLDPEVGARPELGRLTGRGNTTNLELLVLLQPDIIIDIGAVNRTFTDLAERIQAQTGIPYALLDGRFDRIADSYRLMGTLIGRPADADARASFCERVISLCRSRVATVPRDRRPRVYYARGPQGLETGLGNSINVETIEFMGATNVAGGQRGGLATVSLEQVLAWDPDVIVTIDQVFAREVRRNPVWQSVRAVRDDRVHLSPKLPFGWVDFPPAVNRIPGLMWLGKVLYPDLFPEDLTGFTRDFYTQFYHRTPTDAQIAAVLDGRG